MSLQLKNLYFYEEFLMYEIPIGTGVLAFLFGGWEARLFYLVDGLWIQCVFCVTEVGFGRVERTPL